MKYSNSFRPTHLLLLVSAFGSNLALAARNDLCICQIDTFPEEHVKFYKLGCQTWSMGQSCKEKIVISKDDSIEKEVASRRKIESVKLGYVGHWSSASESVAYLKSDVVPVIEKFGVSFDIDNTACSATSNPYQIVKYLSQIDAGVASKIHFRGNQAISTGGWDKMLPGKNNFWATVNGASKSVTFPLCRSFELQQCWDTFQDRETGVCLDDAQKSFQVLRCQENTRRVRKITQGPGGRGSSSALVTQKRHEWVRVKPNLTIHESKDPDSTALVLTVKGETGDNRLSAFLELEDDLSEEQKSFEIVYAKKQIAKDLIRRDRPDEFPWEEDIPAELVEETAKKIEFEIESSTRNIGSVSITVRDSSGLVSTKSFRNRAEAQHYVSSVEKDVRHYLYYEAEKSR